MAEIFTFSTFEEKKLVIEVWATKNVIKDEMTTVRIYIFFLNRVFSLYVDDVLKALLHRELEILIMDTYFAARP